MLDDVRKRVQSRKEGRGGPAPDEVVSALMSGAQSIAEQFGALAGGFLQWSAEARKSVMNEIREIVVRQIEEMGLATKQDVETLRARIDRLEGRAAEGPSKPKPRRSTAPRPRAPRSSSAKPTRTAPRGGTSSSRRRTAPPPA